MSGNSAFNAANGTPRICYVAQGFPNPRGVRWQALARDQHIPMTIVFGISQMAELGSTSDSFVVVPRLGPPTTAAVASLAAAVSRDVALEDVRVVWARDILAGMSAYRLARHIGAFFVLDVCDTYPEVMRLMADRRRWWLPAAALLADRFEGYLARRADLVLTTCPESIEHLLRKHALPPAQRDRMLSVENVPIESSLQPARRIELGPAEPVTMCYVGSYDRGVRDLGTAVRGAEMLRARTGRPWRMRVATFDQGEVESDLQAHGIGADSRIEFVPPMPRSEIPAFYGGAHAGLVPHGVGPVLENTTSNKLFEYIAAGLPVLASGNAPNVRVLQHVGGGVTYTPASAETFSVALEHLLAHEWRLRNDAIWRSEYSWQSQSAPLIERLHKALGLPSREIS